MNCGMDLRLLKYVAKAQNCEKRKVSKFPKPIVTNSKSHTKLNKEPVRVI